MNELLNKFRERMTEKGLTQKDLEEITGITQANLSRYMSGKQKPRSKYIIDKIARALDLSVNMPETNPETTLPTLMHFGMASEPTVEYRTKKEKSTIQKREIPNKSKLMTIVHQEIESIDVRLKSIEGFRNVDRSGLPLFKTWLQAMHKYTGSVLELIEQMESLEKGVDDFNELSK